jgi:DNA mismatch repair protein MutL
MMRIKELPKEVIIKIAAGEVVAGPNSVVKELLENSLDAGADDIAVEIVDGGKALIRVEDNGCGMTAEEMKLSIMPHTTSKISSIDDLYSLQSFGFRGEALASISRVSKMKMISKTYEEEIGTQIEIFGGEIVDEKKVNSKTGTIIEVEDLFYNIPARRKFLKSESVEGRYVTEIIEKFALSNFVNLVYLRDKREIYHFTKDMDLITKCLKIYPELKSGDLIEIKYDDNLIKISGVISNPRVVRSNRTAQTFFVNKRYIKAASLFSILEKGYGEMLEKGKHPYSVIFIDLPPDMVDVNIHPQKLEVKFRDEQKIVILLKNVIRESLLKKTKFTIEFVSTHSDNEEIKQEEITSKVSPIQDLYAKNSNTKAFDDQVFKESTEIFEVTKDNNLYPKTENKSVKNQNIYERNKNTYFDFDSVKNNFEKNEVFFNLDLNNLIRILGTVANRYIIVETKESILIVDFHAAHERYIFEELKKQINEKGTLSTNLLVSSYKINLDEIRKSIIIENKDYLEKLGIIIEEIDYELYVKGLPTGINYNDIDDVIWNIADELRVVDFEGAEKIFDKNLATIACRSAVKTGDDPVGLEKLVIEIFENNLLTCPHGRPIMMHLSFKELDKYFGRTSTTHRL